MWFACFTNGFGLEKTREGVPITVMCVTVVGMPSRVVR